MSRRTSIAIAALAVVAASGGAAIAAGPSPGPIPSARILAAVPPRPLITEPVRLAAPWAVALSPVDVEMFVTRAHASVRLYKDDGSLDPAAVHAFAKVAASVKDGEEPLPERLTQLVIRASHHFGGAAGKKVVIISATRRGAHGKHGTGEAIDFKLEGVRAATLAAYLRTMPLVGVGIYTHPKTQYVHLDVRDRSFHWVDASPPRVTWRERMLPDPKREKRDASYERTMDLPEAAIAIAKPRDEITPTRAGRVARAR